MYVSYTPESYGLDQWFSTFCRPWTIILQKISDGPLCITRDINKNTNTRTWKIPSVVHLDHVENHWTRL